jgi:hypothetical protein
MAAPLLRHTAELGLIAMTMTIISGEFDLSLRAIYFLRRREY